MVKRVASPSSGSGPRRAPGAWVPTSKAETKDGPKAASGFAKARPPSRLMLAAPEPARRAASSTRMLPAGSIAPVAWSKANFRTVFVPCVPR